MQPVQVETATHPYSACYSKTHVLISQQCHGPRGNFSTNRKPLSHSSTTITSHAHRFPNSPQTWLTLGDRELTDTCRAFSISTADPSASPTACTSTCKHITVTRLFKTKNLEQSIKISSHESPCTEGPLSVSKQSEVVSTNSCKKVKLSVQCNTEHRFSSELDYLLANTSFPACFV